MEENKTVKDKKPEVKEDKRKLTALENLRKGREKLLAMKKQGIIPQRKLKPVQEIQVEESESDDETESETEDESESDESEEEYTLKRRKPVEKQKKVPKPLMVKQKQHKYDKKGSEIQELRSMIQQIAMQKQKARKPKKQEKKTVIQVMPTPVIHNNAPNNDALEALRRQIFGNLK
jgi:hypothetical protein